jgi:hypothetical protein
VRGYTVYKDGEPVSKVHPHRETALIEAFQMGAVVSHGADWPGDYEGICLADGFEIREIIR